MTLPASALRSYSSCRIDSEAFEAVENELRTLLKCLRTLESEVVLSAIQPELF